MVATRTWRARWRWSQRSRPPFLLGAGAPTRSPPRPTGTAAAPMPATASLRSRLSDKVIVTIPHRKGPRSGVKERGEGRPRSGVKEREKEAIDGHPQHEAE